MAFLGNALRQIDRQPVLFTSRLKVFCPMSHDQPVVCLASIQNAHTPIGSGDTTMTNQVLIQVQAKSGQGFLC